jgi:hypothetical protein
VERLVGVWWAALRGPTRRLTAAAVLGGLVAAGYAGRVGTTGWRVGVLGGLLALGAGLVGVEVARRRELRDLRRALRRVVGQADPELSGRVDRAYGLAERAAVDPLVGSQELAELHLARLVRRVPVSVVRDGAEKQGRWVQRAAALIATVAAAAAVIGPFHLIEGFDVLAARRQIAPLPLAYLEGLRIEVQPPDYLKSKPSLYLDARAIEAPYGSLITIKGVSLHGAGQGRRLVLSDGKTEVQLAEDGKGSVAARWPLLASVDLDVAARLGEVKVPQGDPVTIKCIPDEAPVVEVDRAPRVVQLASEERFDILYRATDDHGLREVDLVLRSGSREERRVLARLDGDTRRDEGGYQLNLEDRFFKQTFLPVEVRVEARDNDPLTGPKWGKSPPITLVPPAVGEAEARRYEALVAVRTALVELLATEIDAGDDRSKVTAAAAAVEQAIKQFSQGSFSGLRAPARTSLFVFGQLRVVQEALEGARKSPGEAARRKAIEADEGATLAVDRAVRSLGGRDAQSVARRLSKVALEVADGLQTQQVTPADAAAGKQRADVALEVLDPSGKALAKLGPLGADLGSIVANDLRRIRRALAASDLPHAELAARDLAGRLARPNPSFAGGGGRAGATEGGAPGKGSPSDDGADGSGDADEGQQQSFEAGQEALGQLQRDHAGNMEDVQQAQRKAAEDALPPGFLEEAKKHAQAIRDAIDDLPRSGDSDDPSGPAAAARDQGQRMADSLDRGDARAALEAGKAAQKALERARQGGEQASDPLSKLQGRAAGEVGGRLAPEVSWVEGAIEQQRKAMAEKANTKDAARREGQLADQTRSLSDRGQQADSAMPAEMLEALREAESKMRQAQRALERGDAEKGLQHQQEAHRALDQARHQDEAQEQSPADREGTGHAPMLGPAPIPKADDHKGPEDFRRRVMEGLKQGQSPGLKAAIKRYAEKLLR